MYRIPLTVLFIAFSSLNTSAQTTRQLLDSARYNKTKDFAKVIAYSTKAYEKAKADKQTKLEAEGAFVRGLGNYLSGKYDECLRWYFESERLYTSVKDTSGLAELYSDMTIFYLRVKKFKEADEVSKKAIQYAAAINNKRQLPTAVNNRGLMFLDIEKLDSAIVYFKNSYGLYKNINDKLGMSYALDYQASALSGKNELDAALRALGESKQLRAGVGDKIGEVLAITNMGEIYLKQNRFKEATQNFLQTVSGAKALKYTELELYGYEILGQTYAAQGLFKQAYGYQKQHLELKEKAMDAKHNKDIEELQTRYETVKKEQQNKLLTAQSKEQQAELSRNQIGIYALIATIVFTAIIFYLVYNRYRVKQQARFREAMLEEEHLRARGIMDAEENERQRLARELHDGIGQLLCSARRQLEFAQLDGINDADDNAALQMLDDSIKEVRDLSHSMMPPYILNKNLREAIEEFICRLNNKELVNIYTEWVNTDVIAIDKTTTLMLYRSVQEIISNVFKHARAKNIHIELVNHDTELTLMIVDDGIGFDKEMLFKTSKGLGLKNIESRIAYIGGSLDIDTMPGKGVTYVIELPLLSVA
ncbi:MAG: ATP-binding protein [Mucilaginibacter sp.]|jgi:signal transduction histidine kinase|uniref:ATP-binding protein n=1 Tax=Mucilaginibacter sp. TaxID=1882438 RepID=UPI003564D019